jgi:excinuclease ABC subunit C
MRNEAHRFGITHHRNRRSKSAITSELDDIKGIGPKTKEELLQSFKTIRAIKQLSLEELQRVVGLAKAKIIFHYFHP